MKETLELDLRSIFFGKKLELCNICYQKLLEDYEKAKSVIVVRSSHIGGHEIVKNLGKISTKTEYEDFDTSKFELQYNAYKMGGNGIINYRYIKHKKSETNNSGGTYYYSVFTSEGEVVLVEKIKRRF